MTNPNPTTYTTRPTPEPVYFVDPETGDVLELDLSTVTFTKTTEPS